jgi:hypothetical protein
MQVPETKAGQLTGDAIRIAQEAARRAEGKRAAAKATEGARSSEAQQQLQAAAAQQPVETEEETGATGVGGFLDCLSSCCAARKPWEDQEEDGENDYCGSCGSLGAFFAPLQPCWDALVQCLLGLWNSLCGRLQGGNADPVQGFITKWTAPNIITKKMQPAEKQRIAAEFADEFMALPEEIQKAAFTKRFTARHPTTIRRDFAKPEVREATVKEFPVDSRLLKGIRAAHNKQQKSLAKAQAEQQKAEKAGK